MQDIDTLDKLSLIQIKSDAETIKRLIIFTAKDRTYGSIFNLGFLPYLSLCVYESYSLVQKLFSNINADYNVGFSLEDVRLKTKIFEDKLGQNMRFVGNIDYIQNEENKNGLYNIGLDIINSKHLVGNTQLHYYYFQPTNLKKNNLNEVKKLYAEGEIDTLCQIGIKVYEFSFNCGKLIQNLIRKLGSYHAHLELNLHNENFELAYKDLNTNVDINIFHSDNGGKILTLYLMHILCMVNYVIYMLNKVLPDSSTLCLRINYICCYYSIKGLGKIYNYMKTQSLMTDKIECYFKNIDVNDTSLFNKSFRSCMMHYGLKDDLGRAYMDEDDIDISKPFFGLVEKYYKRDYYELVRDINNKLNKISESLEEWLDIKISDLNKF